MTANIHLRLQLEQVYLGRCSLFGQIVEMLFGAALVVLRVHAERHAYCVLVVAVAAALRLPVILDGRTWKENCFRFMVKTKSIKRNAGKARHYL